jgi:hypothetical protein
VLLSISMQMWRNRSSSRNRFKNWCRECTKISRRHGSFSSRPLSLLLRAHAGGDKETTIVTHSPPSSPHLVVTLPPPPPHACIRAAKSLFDPKSRVLPLLLATHNGHFYNFTASADLRHDVRAFCLTGVGDYIILMSPFRHQ